MLGKCLPNFTNSLNYEKTQLSEFIITHNLDSIKLISADYKNVFSHSWSSPYYQLPWWILLKNKNLLYLKDIVKTKKKIVQHKILSYNWIVYRFGSGVTYAVQICIVSNTYHWKRIRTPTIPINPPIRCLVTSLVVNGDSFNRYKVATGIKAKWLTNNLTWNIYGQYEQVCRSIYRIMDQSIWTKAAVRWSIILYMDLSKLFILVILSALLSGL